MNRVNEPYTKADVRSVFGDIVWKAVGSDSAPRVVDATWDEVFRDVVECSGFPDDLNYDDVRLAFGRVLCKRLGVDE